MQKQKHRSLLLAIFIILAMVSVLFSVFWMHSRQFGMPPEQLDLRPSPQISSGVVSIALIGDSWVAGKKLDEFIIAELAQNGWKAKIQSFGHPGARSRLIYENLFKPDNDEHSSRNVLFGEPINLCVVIAGVNDTASYIGADFYTHHIILIVEALRKRGIFPFILELPEYGIEKIDSKNPIGYLRRRLMRLAYHSNKVDVIQDYRMALEEELSINFNSDDYYIIDFDSVTSDYQKDINLYKPDMAHLSDEGRRLLSKQIGYSIEGWLKKRSTTLR